MLQGRLTSLPDFSVLPKLGWAFRRNGKSYSTAANGLLQNERSDGPKGIRKARSQYYGWPREDIDELIACLTEGICTLVPFRIRITVPNAGYAKTFKGEIGPEADFPYMMAHASAMLESTRFLTAHGFREPIDFIFDTASEREQHAVLQAWHFWKRNQWMKERHLMGDPPVFRDDKNVYRFRPLTFMLGRREKINRCLPKAAATSIQAGKHCRRSEGPREILRSLILNTLSN